MKALAKQVGGTHYKDMPVQPWEVMREQMGDVGFGYYLLGNIVKYRMRAGKKAGTDDAAKAEHYTEALQELIDSTQAFMLADVQAAWQRAEVGLREMGLA